MPKDKTDKLDLIPKSAAAEILGKHERSVARHAAAGRLRRHYLPMPGGGQRAMFDRADVERLRHELENPHEQIEGAGAPAAMTTLRPGAVTPAALAVTIADALARAAFPQRGPMLLTLQAAAKRAGVTRADVEHAISTGALPVVELPRTRRQARDDDGRRIRPEALRRWVDAL